MTIAEILRASRASHQAALQARQRKDVVDADRQLRDAYRLRLEADRDDPQHTDAAWIDDESATPRGRRTHAELLAFYASRIPDPPLLTPKEPTDGRPEHPAAEPATQPGEPEPVTADAARADAAEPARAASAQLPAQTTRVLTEPPARRIAVRRRAHLKQPKGRHA